MYYFFKDILDTLVSGLPLGITASLLVTFIYNTVKCKGKNAISGYISSFKNRLFRLTVYIICYLFLIIYRTILIRDNTYDALGSIFGGWRIIYRGYTGYDTQVIGNITMFVPLGILLALIFRKLKASKDILRTALLSLTLSLSIEIIQLITSRGTFQISDLTYNLLGSLIGAIPIIIIYKLYTIKKGTAKKDNSLINLNKKD